jgi:tRNA G18 (ribose-2'-O)-methylase SpoU
VRDACDQLIALPLAGKLDSLNVSAAASAVVYGILHFRRHSVDSAP